MVLSLSSNDMSHAMAALKIIVQTNLHIGNYNHCIEAAEKLMALGENNNSNDYKMYACIGLGQANIMQDNYDVAKQYLDSAYTFAIQLENDSALCSVYNGLGLYHTNADGNYYRAIECYLQGIEAAQRSSNEQLYSLLLCNLSGVYFIKRDPAGLQYAEECYQRGHKLNQSYLIYIGAINTAYCLYLEKNYTEAFKYLNEAELIMKEKNYLNQANVHNLFAAIYFDLKNNEEAACYFKKALNESDQTQTSYISESYLGLGKIAMAEGKYQSALEYLKKGLDISTEKNNALHRRNLYYEISECYEKLGYYMAALETYKKFTIENDSIFNKDKEYVLSDLRIKYETEQKENLLKERDIALITKEKRLQFQYILIFCVVAVCICLYISNKKRNRRYLQIVRQNLYFVEQEKMLRKTLEEKNAGEEMEMEKLSVNNSEKYATSALTEEKGANLYLKLHKIMINNKLYKDNSLTKEKLAELLNTNRTYLSQVINKHTGLSFTHYVNRLRIEEVRRILSDPEDETPLKAIASDTGFNSLSTFYNVFQSIIGMPPAVYRSKMMKICKEKTESEFF
ncbi:hypothetical protein AGMMS50239_06080 [Bacteroidia bacterium]|nr:hypothetical protein AGMMS50239_06080 [Bacteroidia bacterium]